MEILAPAGAEEQLAAAVRSGADAVYLGTKNFNARSSAGNFDKAALKEAVSYCHARGVKVHVTLNTLVNDAELHDLKLSLAEIAESGADAVIVQDLAVAKLLREMCPTIEMHASTQMTITNIDGVHMAQELGFSRAVLARELSIAEIRRITEGSGIEIETFIHGALCMSTSGACYLSSVIGGRSGNRGKCAQPCRLDFRLDGKPYALSLKDMSFVSHAKELENAGVCSFKIEGRMKRPEYVASAVNAVRTAVDGGKPDMTALKAVFSRSGFTDGYYTAKRDADMFGIRTKEDVKASADALGKAAALYRAERQSIPVCFELKLKAGEKTQLTMSDGVRRVSAEGMEPQAAVKIPLNAEYAGKSLGKLGGTPFYMDNVVLVADDGLTLPASELNALRRECAEKLLGERGAVVPHKLQDIPITIEPHAAKEPTLRVRFARIEQVFANDAEYVILPLREVLKAAEELRGMFGDRLVCEIPQLIYDEVRLRADLEKLRELGITNVLVENIGGLYAAREYGFTVHGGSGLNIMNSLSLGEYERLGLSDATVSFELSAKRMSKLGGEIERGVIAYGKLPLMQLRACPARNEKGCPKDCNGRKQLTDRTGRSFPMLCNNRQYTTLYNAVPLYVGDKKDKFRADFFTLYFTDETKKQAQAVYRSFAADEPYDGERTGGLYFREIE